MASIVLGNASLKSVNLDLSTPTIGSIHTLQTAPITLMIGTTEAPTAGRFAACTRALE